VSRTLQVSSIRRFESAKGEKALLPESAGPYARSTGARTFRTMDKSKLGKANSAPLTLCHTRVITVVLLRFIGFTHMIIYVIIFEIVVI
jgi:hypothetical protein